MVLALEISNWMIKRTEEPKCLKSEHENVGFQHSTVPRLFSLDEAIDEFQRILSTQIHDLLCDGDLTQIPLQVQVIPIVRVGYLGSFFILFALRQCISFV